MSAGEYGPMNPPVAIQDLRKKYKSIKEEIEDLMDSSVGDISMYYGVSDSRTQAPSSWSTSNPDPGIGEFIWQKVRISYVDPDKQYKETTPICISGSSISIISTEIKYWVGNPGDPHPDPDSQEWEDEVPEVGPGQCLWTMTHVVYSDGTETISYTLSQSASVNYTWIKYSHYSDGKDPTTHQASMTDTPVSSGALKSIYIGAAYNQPTSTESSDPDDYEWIRYQGNDGYNSADLYLYKRSAIDPSADLSSWPTAEYDFTDDSLSSQFISVVNTQGWYRDISDIATGLSPIYIVSAFAYDQSLTTSIVRTDWSEPIIMAANGYNSAVVFLYKRAASAPAKPTGSFTYTFSTGVLTPISPATLDGWSQEIPENAQGQSYPCWVIQAKAVNTEATDTISSWSTQKKLVQDGHPSGTIVTLYKRSDGVPTGNDAKPSGRLTYTFATGVVSELDTDAFNGWNYLIPTQGPDDPGYIYAIFANAYNTEETDTIAVSDWSSPPILYSKDGINTSVVTIYKRSTGSSPAGPTGSCTYDFTSSTLTEDTTGALNGWSPTLSGATTSLNNNDPIWTMQAVAASSNDSDTIPYSEWTGPVLIANSSYYTYVRYSQYSDGTSFHSGVLSTDLYMGVYVGTSTSAPTDKTMYEWSRFGSTFTWIVYSDDATHNPIYTTPTASTKYIGIAYNKATSTQSSIANDYTWTKYVGDPSTSYWMNVNYSAINKDGDGTYTPSSLTFSGFYQSGSGSVTAYNASWKATFYRSSGGEIVDSGSTGTTYVTRTIPANTTSIKCTMLLNGTNTVVDEQTVPIVYDGVGYTAYLTNESHTFSGTYGQSISGSVTTSAKLYKNTTAQSITVSADTTGLTGVTVTVPQTASTEPVITISISGADPTAITNPGTIPITITDSDNNTFVRDFSYSIAVSGTSATSYWIVTDATTIVKTITTVSSSITNVSYSPASFTVYGKKQTGTGSVEGYTGDFKIYLNDSSTPSTTKSSVSSFTYTIPVSTSNIVNSIRIVMYPAGSATVIDEQTVAVLTAPTDGKGIYSVDDYYAKNNDSSTAPSSWGTTPVVPDAQDPYLWNYELITYTDGSDDSTSPRVIGTYSADGSPGRGISSIVNHYLANNSTTTPSKTDPGWTTTVQQISNQAPYLWNYETITYTNPTSTEDTSICIIGTYGRDGINGIAYTVFLSNESQSFSADTDTALSTTAVTIPYTYKNTTAIYNKIININSVSISGNETAKNIGITGITVTTANNTGSNWPTLTFNISFANPISVSYSIPVALQITDGSDTFTYTKYFNLSILTNGEDGVGVTEVRDVYYLNTSHTAPTKPTDGTAITSTSLLPTVWTLALPTYIADHYYYKCQQITYSDGSIKFTSVIEDAATTSACATADAGATAALNAVSEVIDLYYLSSNGTVPTIEPSTVIYSTDVEDLWTTVSPSIPASATDLSVYKYYTCTRVTTVGGSVAFSDVVEKDVDNLILSWCENSNSTYIDGSRLFAGSVSANVIKTGVLQSNAQTPSFRIDLDNNILEINSFSDIKSSATGESLDQALNNLNSSITNIESYIKVGKIDQSGTLGVEIGASDNAFKSRFVANKISFYEGTDEVAYLSNSKLNVVDARVAVLELAIQDGFNNTNDSEWQIISDINGFSIKWVGVTS